MTLKMGIIARKQVDASILCTSGLSASHDHRQLRNRLVGLASLCHMWKPLNKKTVAY